MPKKSEGFLYSTKEELNKRLNRLNLLKHNKNNMEAAIDSEKVIEKLLAKKQTNKIIIAVTELEKCLNVYYQSIGNQFLKTL